MNAFVNVQIPQRPTQLPKMRRQVAAFITDPDSAIRSRFRDEPNLDAAFDTLGRHLQVADLYWVTPEMSALALAAGGTLPETDWQRDARPASVGLLVFADGVSTIEGLPVDAMTWGPGPGGVLVWCWTHRRRAESGTAAMGALLTQSLPPLIPVWGETLRTDTPIPAGDLPEGTETCLLTLASAWLLMQQPTLATTTTERPPKQQRRAAARRGENLPDVTIIDLRRRYIPEHEPEPGDSGRTYRYRWVVSGHWRDQAYGPGRASRKRIWIPSYEKGPAGAPLLISEKVNVWRR